MTAPEQSRFDQRTRGFERLFHSFGEGVTVEDPNGRVWPFPEAIVGDERTEQRPSELGTEIVITREITIPIDPAGRHEDGRPDILNLRGFATAGGIKYAIEGIETSRAGMAVLQTKRVDFAEVSREQYRRPI